MLNEVYIRDWKEFQKKFHDTVQYEIRNTQKPESLQERWNRVAAVNKEAGAEFLGYREKSNKKVESKEIEKLSNEQLALKSQIEGTKDINKRSQMKEERNAIMRKIKEEIKKNEERVLIEKVVG